MHNVAQLRRLRAVFPNELVVIGVHSAKFPSEKVSANIREAAQRHGIDHPVVNDAGFRVWGDYNVTAWPTVVLIDPQGEIIGAQPGEISAQDFIPVIESMLEQYDQQGLIDRTPVDFTSPDVYKPRSLLRYPSKLLAGPEGRLFVADTGHHRIIELQVDSDYSAAEVRRVFGSGRAALQDGPADEAAFHHPHGMALAGQTLYVADTDNHTIRAIDLESGNVRTVAGTGELGRVRGGPGGPTEIPLRSPWALSALENATEDGKPVLFIAMAGSHQIWLMLGEERLGVFAGSGREALTDGALAEAAFNQPSDLALGLGHLFVADAEASAVRAIVLDDNPRVLTLVGQGLFEFGDADGIGSEVRLQHAAGIAFSETSRYVYIADSYNHKIKRLDPGQGRVETLIGTGEPGDADGAFETAQLFQPEGVVVAGGRLLIADTNNHLLRVADLEQRTLSSLVIRGVDRLPVFREEEEGDEPRTERLPEVTTAGGLVTVNLDVGLPAGYHINLEAPNGLRLVESCSGATIQAPDAEAGEGMVALGSPEDQRFVFQVNTDEDCELVFDVTVYYCQSGQERLCLIDDRRLALPVRVTASGPVEANLSYSVPAR